MPRAIHQRVLIVAPLFAQHGFEGEKAPRLLKHARKQAGDDAIEQEIACNRRPERRLHHNRKRQTLQHERKEHKRDAADPERQVVCAFFAKDDVEHHRHGDADQSGKHHCRDAQPRYHRFHIKSPQFFHSNNYFSNNYFSDKCFSNKCFSNKCFMLIRLSGSCACAARIRSVQPCRRSRRTSRGSCTWCR